MDTSNDGGTTTTFTPSPNSPPTTTTYPNAPQTQRRDPPVSYVRSHSDRYRRRRRRQWMRVTMAATTTTAAPPPLSPDRPCLTPTPTPYPNAPQTQQPYPPLAMFAPIASASPSNTRARQFQHALGNGLDTRRTPADDDSKMGMVRTTPAPRSPQRGAKSDAGVANATTTIERPPPTTS